MKGFQLEFEDNAQVQSRPCEVSEEELTLEGWPPTYKCRLLVLAAPVGSGSLGYEGTELDVKFLAAAPAYDHTNWSDWLAANAETPLRVNAYPLLPGVMPRPSESIPESERLTGIRATLVRIQGTHP